MKVAPRPDDEQERLCAVYGLELLDTAPEERFDSITRAAREQLSVPISTITLVDRDREWYKSAAGLETHEGPRDISFCGHALMQEAILVIEDTLEDERFKDNPMVTNPPHIRFYAGKSLYDRESHQPVGVFCVKDTKPRKLSVADIALFLDFAERAEDEVNKKV